VTETVDPLAGSYYVENLTNEIEADARSYLDKIAQMGGMIPAIEAGYVQSEISNSAYEYQKKVESRDRTVVGVNRFQIEEPPPEGLLKVRRTVEEAQAEKLRILRRERSRETVQRSLDEIRTTARTEENLMPVILKAVKAEATIGEICDAMRDVFGEYRGGTAF